MKDKKKGPVTSKTRGQINELRHNRGGKGP
jgi:hypothetical protein